MTVLPTDWYHVTPRQATKEDYLRLVWTVDRGEHAYRNIIQKFPLNDWGMERLQNLMNGLKYIIDTDYESDYFLTQFINTDIRGLARVDSRVDNSGKVPVVRNEIIEFKIPTRPPRYNVKREKDSTFYHKNNKGKGLPIEKRSREDDS